MQRVVDICLVNHYLKATKLLHRAYCYLLKWGSAEAARQGLLSSLKDIDYSGRHFDILKIRFYETIENLYHFEYRDTTKYHRKKSIELIITMNYVYITSIYIKSMLEETNQVETIRLLEKLSIDFCLDKQLNGTEFYSYWLDYEFIDILSKMNVENNGMHIPEDLMKVKQKCCELQTNDSNIEETLLLMSVGRQILQLYGSDNYLFYPFIKGTFQPSYVTTDLAKFRFMFGSINEGYHQSFL